MNKPWDYLVESDAKFRNLERKWQQTGNMEDAQAFVRGSRSVGNTTGDTYNEALWFIGEKPPTDDIYQASMYLVNTMDQLILEFNIARGGGSQMQAGDILLGANQRAGHNWLRFTRRVEKGIIRPKDVTFKDVALSANLAKTIIPNLRRNRVRPSDIAAFLRALTTYRQLIGR